MAPSATVADDMISIDRVADTLHLPLIRVSMMCEQGLFPGAVRTQTGRYMIPATALGDPSIIDYADRFTTARAARTDALLTEMEKAAEMEREPQW